MADTFPITAFESLTATVGDRYMVTWEQLTEQILSNPATASTPKEELSMWSAAAFEGNHSAVEDVISVSLLVFDVDLDPVPSLADMRNFFGGLRWFAHSSSSSRADALRWRLIVDVSRPIMPAEYTHVWQAFTERLPFAVGPQSKDASRRWFTPRCGEDGTFITSERHDFARTV